MSKRQLLATVLLALVAELTLLGVFAFLAEPQRVGGPVHRFHTADVTYVAVPFVLRAAAAAVPLLTLLRRPRKQA